MTSVRVESDIFGELEIPREALFGVNTQRTVQNLSFSGRTLSKYPEYIQTLCLVKKAAATANVEAGILSEEVYNAISFACTEISSGIHNGHFPVDMLHGGGGIGVNMNINEVIANVANEYLGGERGTYSPVHHVEHVNASQSTSDVCHTSIRMAILVSYQSLKRQIESLIEAIEDKVVEFQEVTTISRTCLQDGIRIKVGESFSGYAAGFKRCSIGIADSMNALYQVNLGGTVIGSGRGAPVTYRDVVVERLSDISGLPLKLRANLFDAAKNIDDLARVSGELRIFASSLIKMAKDFRLLSSGPEAGFAEFQLPAIQAGSSFFPGKVNPVLPETLIQCGFQIIACDRAVQATLEHGELDLNVFEGAAGANLLEAMKMLECTLMNFTSGCIRGMELNRQRCEELSNSIIPLTVDLKEAHGYQFVSRLLKEEGPEGVKNYSEIGGDTSGTNQ